MNHAILRALLACPKCNKNLKIEARKARCTCCHLQLTFSNGIWHSPAYADPKTVHAQSEYDQLFKTEFGGPTDGSYEILASFVKGKRSVDIGCGTGLLLAQSLQTVGVDFSLQALKTAQKKGAKFLMHADAHALPFKENAFEVAISSGNLEHFADPQKAVYEMARISKMQMMVVHKYPPVPFARHLFPLVSRVLAISHQPIEKPLSMKEIEAMCSAARLSVIFKGVWTLPFNYGRVIKMLPEFRSIPSAHFIITIKK